MTVTRRGGTRTHKEAIGVSNQAVATVQSSVPALAKFVQLTDEGPEGD